MTAQSQQGRKNPIITPTIDPSMGFLGIMREKKEFGTNLSIMEDMSAPRRRYGNASNNMDMNRIEMVSILASIISFAS